MAAKTQRIEVMLETLLESVDLAESISMRVAEAAGFPEEEVHKIGMAVREGVINAYNYGNQQDRRKKIMMSVELQPENMIVRVYEVLTNRGASQNALMVRTSGEGRRLEAIYVKALNAMFYVDTDTGVAGVPGAMERLPISKSVD